MKSIKYIFGLLLFFILSACNEDFLEKNPEDTLSPEVFYTDAINLETGLFGVYEALTSADLFGRLPELDGVSDNAIAVADATQDLKDFARGMANPSLAGDFTEYYLAAYTLIQRANLLLDNIDIPGQITPDSRKTIEFEARALRALAYLQLVYLYGDVPLLKSTITYNESLSLIRAPRAEIIEFILSELDAAAKNLTATPFNKQVGRFTSLAALSFKAKVLLYEARLGNKPWSEAKAAIQEAITLAEANGKNLFTDGNGNNGLANYTGIFRLSNEDNKEVIFSLKANVTEKLPSFISTFAPSGANLVMSVHQSFVNDFYTTAGLPITDPASMYNPSSPYQNRDPRLFASIYVPKDTFSNGTTKLVYQGASSNRKSETDFLMKKWTTTDGITRNDGDLDVILFRFADLLLMFAEAENEGNGPTAEAYTAVNRIRARVKMPNFPAGLSKAQFKNEVIHERRVEFGFEGQRWFDLVTLRIANEKINAIKELGRAFVPNKQELFPIPLREINLNPKLTQNAGY